MLNERASRRYKTGHKRLHGIRTSGVSRAREKRTWMADW